MTGVPVFVVIGRVSLGSKRTISYSEKVHERENMYPVMTVLRRSERPLGIHRSIPGFVEKPQRRASIADGLMIGTERQSDGRRRKVGREEGEIGAYVERYHH